MTPTTERTRTIAEDMELGLGMLIAESEDGSYHPIAVVNTISEGREMAASDMRVRQQSLEDGGDPMCPLRYQVWARLDRGNYIAVAGIEA